MEEQKEKKDSSSGRRGFVRKLLGVVAASGLAGLLLGRSPQPALAATNTFPADGNVGIGTLSPARMLHIQGNGAVARLDRDVDSASFIFVRTKAGDFNTIWKSFTFGVKATGADSGSFFIGDMHTNVLGSSDNRLLIDSTGRVGMGTTDTSGTMAPGSLTINRRISNLGISGAGIMVGTGAGEYAQIVLGIDNTKFLHLGWDGSDDYGFVNTDTNVSKSLVLQAGVGGKVGVGTTTPSSKLDVLGSTGYNQLRMRTPYTPTPPDTNGNTGDIAWDDNYIYVKTSVGWKRSALSPLV